MTLTPIAAHGQQQRVDHVVAIAEIGELAPGSSPNASCIVSRSLSACIGCQRSVEAVEDRERGGLGELHEIGVGGDAGDDAVDVAAQDLRGVGDRFAPLDLQVVDAEEDGLAAELGHAGLERDAGAGAGVLEDHAERLAGQVAVRLDPLAHLLQADRRVEHLVDLVSGEVGVGQDAAALQAGAEGERGRFAALAPPSEMARGARASVNGSAAARPGQAGRRLRYRSRIATRRTLRTWWYSLRFLTSTGRRAPVGAPFAGSGPKGREASAPAVPPFLRAARHLPRRAHLSVVLAWEPPTRTYLSREATFFGQPLGGAFQASPPLPGFHHPRVALAVRACTPPRRRGGHRSAADRPATVEAKLSELLRGKALIDPRIGGRQRVGRDRRAGRPSGEREVPSHCRQHALTRLILRSPSVRLANGGRAAPPPFDLTQTAVWPTSTSVAMNSQPPLTVG